MKKFWLSALVAVLMFIGLSQASVTYAAASTSTIITTGSPYLKSAPYTQQGKTYGVVPKGTKLDVLEKTNQYYVKVKYKSQTGYISTKYIQYQDKEASPSNPNAKPENWEKVADRIIANAKKLQSKVKYQYGKYDEKNFIFDCSSFTAYLYKQEGINMKWGARAQFQGATEISKSQLRKGDLVFISTNKTAGYKDKVQKIGHVGIYIGDNKIIHNLSPEKDVTISDLNSTWYKNHYVTAARIIK
ncbi:hypothetical protein E0485_14085 [Paenibacillus albiflavus]|uniref:Uncharacterized protein n=1 Tax=Paenibacillus albiflavus TaxID=2545760 RepID=A0A4R4E930_9BACL|nr:NlpC/P60 family protein [Paenibacillus albiflavus]TCZ76326.1 hypothetical protein E0485_14085 [Paenibacillus albiflavus]